MLIRFLITIIFCVGCWMDVTAQTCFKLYANQTSSVSRNRIGTTITNSTIIKPFSKGSVISGLSISGKIDAQEDFLVRVILQDNTGKEYIVMELYDELYNKDYSSFSDYCEETALLDKVQPSQLKIVVKNAALTLSEIQWSGDQSLSLGTKSIRLEIEILRKQQLQSVVDRINLYNEQRGKLWRAGITNLSLQGYDIKKRLLGITDNDCSEGLEYYAGGIIDLGSYDANTIRQMRTSTDYVESFDWRNRHGKNWLTPIKNQWPSQGCTAFTIVACAEALTNLYYNRKLDLTYSEQEIICCAGVDSVFYKGMKYRPALNYLVNHGICDDDSYPFEQHYVSECRRDSISPSDTIRFDSYDYLGENGISDTLIKRSLIQKGPLVSGYYYAQSGNNGISGHAMALVGYGTVHAGDTIRVFGNSSFLYTFYVVPDSCFYEGRTYYIFKNSWGENGDLAHGGYMYIMFNNMNRIVWPYSENYPITTMNYTDADIVCGDADGDGYYFWGLGPKPAHCPSWAPETPDGDDHDINYGPMDKYGHLASLPDGITIKTAVPYETDSTTTKRIGIVENGTLTITGTTTLAGDAKIRVCEGGTLIVDGGTLNNAKIELVPGGHLIVRNNGTINMAMEEDFEAPIGAIVDIEHGSIN